MKIRLLTIIGCLMAAMAVGAQSGGIDPTNPPEPSTPTDPPAPVVKYKLTLTSDPLNCTSTLSGAGEYEEGKKISLRTAGKTWYTFKRWEKNGETVSTSANFTYTMPASDVELTAVYEFNYNPSNPGEPQKPEDPEPPTYSYPLYLQADPVGGGTFNYTSGTNVVEGTKISIKATPATGFVFVGWYNEYGKLLGSNATLSNYVMPSSATTLTARFNYSPTDPGIPSGSQEEVDNNAEKYVELTPTLAAGAYYATYYNAEGTLKADAYTTVYKVAQKSATKLMLTPIADKLIPKETAVILKSSFGNMVLTKTTETATGDYTDNILEGTAAEKEVGSDIYYVMAVDEGELCFQKYSGSTLAAGQVFIPNSKLTDAADKLTFNTETIINFVDAKVKAICVAKWDTNGDGELSEEEAAAVTSLNKAFRKNKEITSFDELRYFTGLTAVSDMDFFFCTSLVSMTLPKNLADVPETTFTGCESLTNLKVAEGNEYYCTIDGLLYDKNITLLLFCPTKKTGAVVVPATVKKIGTNGFYECAELTAITLPDKLEELGDAVFVGCTNLTTIHIPASVKIMGLGQVSACTNLESITVDEANTYFQSIDGVLYTKSDITLMSYPNKKGKEYVVQDGTKGIDAYSFCYTEIEKVTLPASIIGIGYLAFGYCENLKTIVSLNPSPITAGIRPDIMNDDEYEGVTLMVPYGSKSLYEASNGWNMFTNIVEMPDANAITVTADNLTMEYGDAIPELTYKVEGGVLAGTPELSCEATSTSPAGTYDIIVSKGTVENENVTYVAGKLTINQAPLTISAGTYTKKQYDPMPEIVLTYDGFKNNETAIMLTKQATISCEADEDSAPGEYTITLSGAEAANYEISYVAGKLTVNEPDSFTLAYIVDGELYRSFIVKYKEAITPLEEPTKEGYTFSGWSEIPETMPAHDVTVTGTFTLDPTGINQIMRDENGNAMIFTIDGRRVDKPQKNLNIIRMKDGTTRKVMVK